MTGLLDCAQAPAAQRPKALTDHHPKASPREPLNFIGRDYTRSGVNKHFPREDMRKFGITPEGLDQHIATPAFVALMRHEVGVARAMLRQGAELHRMVDRRLSRDLIMFAGGGLAILNAIERVGYDVFNRRPKLTKLDYLRLGVGALRGRLPG